MTMRDAAGRIFASLIAVVGFVSLLAQALVIVQKGAERGYGALPSLWWMLGYFTILTNIAIVVVMVAIAVGQWPRRWPAPAGLLASLTASIVLVCAVYHLLLGDLWNPVGLHWWADLGLHTLMPLLMFGFWFTAAPKQGLRYRDVGRWLIFPLCYGLYAQARGAIEGWYPYPFVDAKALGYGRVIVNSLGIGLVFACASLGMIALAKALDRRTPSP